MHGVSDTISSHPLITLPTLFDLTYPHLPPPDSPPSPPCHPHHLSGLPLPLRKEIGVLVPVLLPTNTVILTLNERKRVDLGGSMVLVLAPPPPHLPTRGNGGGQLCWGLLE